MTIEMIVALIGASVVAYAIANRFRLIAPVLLIAAGVGVALLPVGEEMYLPSTVVLTIFLPILLYWESLSVSLNRMRRSLRGIILSATVLAVVTCGIVISRFAAPHMSLGSRVLGIPFWTILTHILNTILFVMVGVALPGIVAELPRADLVRGLILIPIIYIAMVAGRFAGQHLIIYSIRALDRRPEQRLRRTNIRGRIVSTVAGFRGAISLAMALSIPTSFDGAAYAERNLIILVVAGATLLSLLIQGLALPYVVRWANARPSAGMQTAESVESQETEALADILADTISQLDAIAERAGVDDDAAIEAVRADYARRHDSVSNANAEEEASVYGDQESALRLAVIEQLRERVQSLRFAGRIDDSTASRVNRRFDVETLHINGPLDVE